MERALLSLQTDKKWKTKDRSQVVGTHASQPSSEWENWTNDIGKVLFYSWLADCVDFRMLTSDSFTFQSSLFCSDEQLCIDSGRSYVNIMKKMG